MSLRQSGRIAAIFALAASLGCDAGPAPPGPSDPLPACASPIGRAVWEAMQPVWGNSTISPERAMVPDGWVDPRILMDGPEIFPRWAELITGAQGEVNMQFYKWEPGTDPTRTLIEGMQALEARRRREGSTDPPVVIRIIVDTSTIGAAAPVTSEYFPTVVAQLEAAQLDPAHVSLELAAHERTLLDTFGNLHVKAIIVDGRLGAITGANPEAQHNFAMPWHDSGYVVAGAAALLLQEDWEYSWARSQRWICPSTQNDPKDCLRPTEAAAHRTLPAQRPDGFASACALYGVTRAPSALSNNAVDNPQDQAYLAVFAKAQRVLRIETPNINDDAFKAGLLAAIDRGVEVQLLIPKGFNDGSERSVGGTNEEIVGQLYAAVAHLPDPCSRLRIRWYSRDGVSPPLGNGPYANHSKYLSVDDRMVIGGTTNMDTASWNFSHELNLAFDDEELTRGFDARLFQADWSRAIPVDQCRAP